MDPIYLILIAIAAVFFHVMTKLGELDSKLNLLMSANSIDWSKQFNEEVHTHMLAGNFPKAAKALRQKTGLPLAYCLEIIQTHQHNQTLKAESS